MHKQVIQHTDLLLIILELPKLMKRAIRYLHTDGRTKPNYRKSSLLKITMKEDKKIYR